MRINCREKSSSLELATVRHSSQYSLEKSQNNSLLQNFVRLASLDKYSASANFVILAQLAQLNLVHLANNHGMRW